MIDLSIFSSFVEHDVAFHQHPFRGGHFEGGFVAIVDENKITGRVVADHGNIVAGRCSPDVKDRTCDVIGDAVFLFGRSFIMDCPDHRDNDISVDLFKIHIVTAERDKEVRWPEIDGRRADGSDLSIHVFT